MSNVKSSSMQKPFAMIATTNTIDPSSSCCLCPRLTQFRVDNTLNYPLFFNAPVPCFMPTSWDHGLMIVGLAPGLRGANATGRPFTGDAAGILLYEMLKNFGFTRGNYNPTGEDGLELINCFITNSVKCVPPKNKPLTQEIRNCSVFLKKAFEAFRPKIILCLGIVAHSATLSSLAGTTICKIPFAHGKIYPMDVYTIVDSYHCSLYNTNTRRLTSKMFYDVFKSIKELLLK